MVIRQAFTLKILFINSGSIVKSQFDILLRMENKNQMQAKIVLCGDGFVGKSTLRERYLGIAFRPAYLQTIGADYATKNQDYANGTIRLQIWDLAGQQKFFNIREAFYKGTDGVVLIYDVSQRATAERTFDWIKEIQRVLNEPVPIVLVGNKNDLRTETETLSSTEGYELAKKLSLPAKTAITYIDASAKTGENVESIFRTLANKIVNFDLTNVHSPLSEDIAFKKYFEEVKNVVHLYFFKMTPVGPSCLAQTDHPKDDILLLKMAVFYSTTLGQGTNSHTGMFGPLPIPESKDTRYTELESLIFSFNKADKNHHDPRAKGINFCFIVLTVAKDLLFQFANTNFLNRFFHSQTDDLQDVDELTKEYLIKLKQNMLKDIFTLNKDN